MIYNGFRSIFFNDQNVFEKDLNNIEYSKIRLLRDTLATGIKQPGVAIDSLSENDLKVVGGVVNPGSAIDKFGRLIYVPLNTAASGSIATDPYYHPAWPSRTAVGGGNYTNIYYDIQYDIPENDDSGTLHYIRAYDSYRILNEGSAPSAESGGICLAISGGDCRPLLQLRGVVSAYPAGDAFIGKVQVSTLVNATVGFPTTITWNIHGIGGKKAEIAFRRYAGENLLNIRFIASVVGYSGVLSVTISTSINGATAIFKNFAFPASSNVAYTFPVPITSLSVDSLYFITLSFTSSGNLQVIRPVIYTSS